MMPHWRLIVRPGSPATWRLLRTDALEVELDAHGEDESNNLHVVVCDAGCAAWRGREIRSRLN